MNSKGYTPLQITLHWLSAIVIVWALMSGFAVAYLDLAEPVGACISFVNVSLTTLLIPFFVLRMAVAIRRAAPLASEPMERVAGIAHWLLYLLTGAVLVTGVLMMDRDINVFNVLRIPAPLEDGQLIAMFLRLHIGACVALAALVAVHVLAVLKHQLAGRRPLARMWL